MKASVTPTVTAQNIVDAVNRVHTTNPKFAAVLEKMDEKSGEEMCKVITSVFVPVLDRFERIPFAIAYAHAMFDIAPFEADDLAVAIVDDLVAHGADHTAKARIRETCGSL